MLRSALPFLLIACGALWLGAPKGQQRSSAAFESGTGSASASHSLLSKWIDQIGRLLHGLPSIRGQLVDASGTPLPDHAITAQSVETPAIWGAATTDEKGRFVLHIEHRATFNLFVRDARHWAMLPTVLPDGGVRVVPGAAEVLLRIPTERTPTAFVRGRILLRGATGHSKLSFGLMPLAKDGGCGGFVFLQDPARGSFEFGPVPSGDYRMVVSAQAPDVTWHGPAIELGPHEQLDLGDLRIPGTPSAGDPPAQPPAGPAPCSEQPSRMRRSATWR